VLCWDVRRRDRNWQEILKLLDHEITGETIQLKGFSGVVLKRKKVDAISTLTSSRSEITERNIP